MAGNIEAFFERLGGHDTGLAHTTGTIRIDLEDDGQIERWLISIRDGDVSVSRRNAKADCVLRMGRSVFEGMVAGKVNSLAAVIRGIVTIEGHPGLVVRLQRLFPGPGGSRHPRAQAAEASR